MCKGMIGGKPACVSEEEEWWQWLSCPQSASLTLLHITMATAFPSPPSLCLSLSCSERSGRDRHKSHSRDSSSRSDKNVTISTSSAQPPQPDQSSAPTDAQVSEFRGTIYVHNIWKSSDYKCMKVDSLCMFFCRPLPQTTNQNSGICFKLSLESVICYLCK